jgi:hypothetical protein
MHMVVLRRLYDMITASMVVCAGTDWYGTVEISECKSNSFQTYRMTVIGRRIYYTGLLSQQVNGALSKFNLLGVGYEAEHLLIASILKATMVTSVIWNRLPIGLIPGRKFK